MADHSELFVRPLGPGDVDAYIAHVLLVDAESGIDGAPHSHPYLRSELEEDEGARERELDRWAAPLDEPGWRRGWGLLDADRIVGHLYLAGGDLRSEMHRISMGMGIVSTHHRRGGGSMLLASAIEWARDQPDVAWLDLGVFGDNAAARALYERHGFAEIGTIPDRFRVDGVSLDDVMMTLDVATAASHRFAPNAE